MISLLLCSVFWQALIPTGLLPSPVLGAIMFLSSLFLILTLCALRLVCWVVFSPLTEITNDIQLMRFSKGLSVLVDPFAVLCFCKFHNLSAQGKCTILSLYKSFILFLCATYLAREHNGFESSKSLYFTICSQHEFA